MTGTTLQELLERNARHVESLPEDYFDAVQTGQEPAVVSVCCSDSRVSQEGMWAVDEPGWLFTPSTIGNQVWNRRADELVVDGSVLYPTVAAGTDVATVVGHTGCGALTAALETVRERSGDDAGHGHAITDRLPDVEHWVAELLPVVEDGLADDRVDPDRPEGLVDQLVEYNVDRQVAFMCERPEVPDDVTVYGFVYDFQGVYGDQRGRTYLVNADGETDPEVLADLVPASFDGWIRRLL